MSFRQSCVTGSRACGRVRRRGTFSCRAGRRRSIDRPGQGGESPTRATEQSVTLGRGNRPNAALHDEAPSAGETDWPQILALYEMLRRMSDNPMVAINHAVSAAMVHGPATGLKLVDALASDARIAGHYRLDAVRAHLHERAGDYAAAIRCYLAAAGGTTSLPERHYLLRKAARLQ